jgi:hypothetical protein
MAFHNLPKTLQDQILDYTLMVYFCSGTDKEKLDWFRIINIAGERLTDQELRNAVYTGPWLTHAKPIFSKPKLRPIRQAISGLGWAFAVVAGWCSGYFEVSGIAAPMSSKACRWALVGSVSIAMVTWVPVYRTWLRVKVARCSSRPRKLR